MFECNASVCAVPVHVCLRLSYFGCLLMMLTKIVIHKLVVSQVGNGKKLRLQ